MCDAIVFVQRDDGTWEVFDHGPSIVMFARYRTGTAPGPLFLVEFDREGRPTACAQRSAT